MLAPVHVVAGRIILLRMGAPAFLARLGGHDGGQRIRHQVGQFQRLHQVAVPDQAAIGHLDVLHPAGNPYHLAHALGQSPVGSEYRRIRLHRLLHPQAQLGRRRPAIGMAQRVEPRQRPVHRRTVHLRYGLRPVHHLPRPDRRRPAEDDKVDQTVRPQPVRAMHAGTARLAHGHQPRLHPVGVIRRRVQHLAPVIRRNPAHVVMHRRQHRDRLPRDIDAGKDARTLRNPRQAQLQRLPRQVVEVEVDVVLLLAHAPPLADLERHAAADHIARGQVLVGRRIALHEPLALGIGEIPPLAACAFGDQTPRTIDAGRMELHEFHVLQRQSRPRDHAAAVARAGMRARRAEIGAPIPARRQDHHLGAKDMHRPVVKLPGQHPFAGAVLTHQKVDGEILDIEFRLLLQALAIQRVQDRMPRPVSGRAGPLHGRTLAEFRRMPAEGPLVDAAILGPAEGHAVMLKLIDRLRRLAGQVLHRIRITQPVRPLDGVVHVPLPVIGPHVAKARRDPALRRHRMAAGRKDLGDAGRPQPLLGHPQRRPQARPPGPHDDNVIGMGLVCIGGHGPVAPSVLFRRRCARWQRAPRPPRHRTGTSSR